MVALSLYELCADVREHPPDVHGKGAVIRVAGVEDVPQDVFARRFEPTEPPHALTSLHAE